jgi:Tol biopolymer transport system component
VNLRQGLPRAWTSVLTAVGVCCATLALAGCSSGDETAADGGLSGSWIVYEGPIEGSGGVTDAGNRLVRPDGTGDFWVTPDVPRREGGWQLHPDWSPDGSRLAFAVDQAGESPPNDTRDIWVSNADGTHAKRVFDCRLPCVESDGPAWSPDGRTLVFGAFDAAQGEADNVRLMLLDLESGKAMPLVVGKDDERLRGPRWSPDGRTVVLEVWRYSSPAQETLVSTRVATTSLDDSAGTITPLTDPSAWATYPDWHPTDDLIVYSTRPWTDLETGPSELFTMRSDGSQVKRITHFGAVGPRAVQPSWTPDGERIIFTSVEGTGFGEPTMATIRPDGTGLESATSSGPMFGTHPRLRPSP